MGFPGFIAFGFKTSTQGNLSLRMGDESAALWATLTLTSEPQLKVNVLGEHEYIDP